jgi:hypothetical protein
MKNENTNPVVKKTSCFKVLNDHKVDCQRKKCDYWIDNEKSHNCVNILAKNGPYTLQEIGNFYGLTRMRICQIEKDIYEKIKSSCLC